MYHKFLKVIFSPLSLVISIIVVFLRPLILIRFSLLPDIRIGHFAQDISIYLIKKKIEKTKRFYFDIFCFTHKHDLANKFLKKKWKEKLNIQPNYIVVPVIKLINFYYTFLPIKNLHKILLTEFDKENLIAKNKKSIIEFSISEKKIGQKTLLNMGVPFKKKFIILIIRDNAYLKKTQPEKDWNYHNHRDMELNKFIDLVKTLTSLGYYVIRMGKIVSKPFPFKNKKFIDYPYSDYKSDFMDIYLCANSYFTISTLTGLDSISRIFKRPILGIQFPWSYSAIFNHADLITMPKLFCKNKNKILNTSEIINLMKKDDYNFNPKFLPKLNISIIENSKKEIKDAGLDMLKYLKNSKKNKQDQNKFWNQLNKLLYYKKNYFLKKNQIKTKISYSFFKKNYKMFTTGLIRESIK